ncbi:MAG: enhanced intracellular survival protein Eis [Dehalococcoidia bacterium]
MTTHQERTSARGLESSATIRPAEPEEMPEFSRIVALSLALDPNSFEMMRPEWTLCAFEAGRLATCYAAWPFTMRLNGAPVPIAGVTTVSTAPVYRRRGHLRSIMDADFHRLHESGGAPIAALYASLAAIYQRYGYGIVSTHVSYQVEPRYLAFSQPATLRGGLRELTRDDAGLLNDIYRRFRDPRNGYLHRSRASWAVGPLAPAPDGHTLSILLYEEDGEPQGYVIYTTGHVAQEGPGPDHLLQIRDLVWLTPSAYRAFWEHIARFDLVRDVVWRSVPTDDPLPHLLLEPRMLRATARDGILARIVDLPRTLTSRPYSAPATLTCEIRDEMCPWNAGRWTLETSGPETRVERTTAEPHLTMPIQTLSMLLFGQISPTEATRMGRLDAHDESALESWDAAMRTRYRPYCADQF